MAWKRLSEHYPDYTVNDRPLPWQRAGLQQTASGYGNKLTTSRVVCLPGERRYRRVYITRWGNAGTAWITIKGETYIVD